MQIGNKEPVPGSFSTITGFILVSGYLFHQQVWLLMIIKIKRYLSAYNEFCGVNVEAAYNYMKLIIGNQISGTGNRESGTSSFFLI